MVAFATTVIKETFIPLNSPSACHDTRIGSRKVLASIGEIIIVGTSEIAINDTPVGALVGIADGAIVVGTVVGSAVGIDVGSFDGMAVGVAVGVAVGDGDGAALGTTVGEAVGVPVGDFEGAPVGSLVVGELVGLVDGLLVVAHTAAPQRSFSHRQHDRLSQKSSVDAMLHCRQPAPFNAHPQ